jgi:hypothetical protein
MKNKDFLFLSIVGTGVISFTLFCSALAIALATGGLEGQKLADPRTLIGLLMLGFEICFAVTILLIVLYIVRPWFQNN